jgi:Transposase DDE domain
MDPNVLQPPLAAAPPADGPTLAQSVGERCHAFLSPLLADLDAQVDRRLLRTLASTIPALIRHRDRPHALLLSELGAELAGPQHAPAGTKRLANLLHSRTWTADQLDAFLLARGRERVEVEATRVPEGRALCILDGSVLEKPESLVAEGLGPVRSSKARRLSRPRPQAGPGYYRGKPGGPIVVPGFEWLGVLVTGWAAQVERRPVALGAWSWYAKPRPTAAEPAAPNGLPQQRAVAAERAVLAQVVAAWGSDRLLHVWDRGFSGAAWLGDALDAHWHFVVRWKKGNRLRPATAASVGNPAVSAWRQDQDGIAAWRLTAGLRAWDTRLVVNPRHPDQPTRVAFAARPVRLLHRDDPLWLVVVRLGRESKRRRRPSEPWRLLTTEPVETAQQCWRIVEAYAARWQIEQMLRFGKSELGIESLRVRRWAVAHKLLALVGVTYAFLVDLLGDGTDPVLPAILRWAHRTGRQAREAWRSLYRLRAGLAALWQRHTPVFQGGP